MTRLALRFISGKYQGGEFPLRSNREIVIGRSSDLDMVLVEDMVSRKHAKISWHNDSLVIEDLGSTNGTFVNESPLAPRTPTLLNDRTTIRVGNVKLFFRYVSQTVRL